MSGNDSAAGKHGRPAYALTERERHYLQTGDPGTYRESKMQTRIEDKVEDLGHRIDHLLSDIRLLHGNGYLEEDTWGDTWEGFIGFEESEHTPKNSLRDMRSLLAEGEDPTPADIADACTLGPKPGKFREFSAPEAVSRDVGRMLFRVMLTPDGVNQETLLKDMGWGFIEGLYLDHRIAGEARGDHRQEKMNDLFDYFEERLELALEYDEQDDLLGTEKPVDHDRTQTEAEFIDEIRAILEDEGIPAKPSDDYRSETASEGVFPREVLDLLVDDLVDDTEIDHPHESSVTGSGGQWILFNKQYGPYEEMDPASIVTREHVLEIISRYNLVTKGKLSVQAVADAEELEETKWRGIHAKEILSVIAKQEGAPRSKLIARELKTTDHESIVTKLCNDMAGREWEIPLLKGDASGWEITAYGRLTADAAFGYEFGPLSAHGTTEEDVERIAAAADEAGIEQWEYNPTE